MNSRRAVCTVLAAVAASLGLLAPSAVAAAPTTTTATPVVGTDKGVVRGAATNGVDGFLGIPYAAPPVGALRWVAPQQHAPWNGTYDATHFGSRCTALASTNGARTNSEDCLYLNVWRPTGTTGNRKLPVYVFIHGGGLVNGSSNQAAGDLITRQTNAVTVSLNYRLGVFGFVGLPGLDSGTGNGNFGFLDQQAALRWVQRNIAAFGGDPGRVTVGGESAGAFSVCGHLVAAGSQGLFSQAMMESGSCPSRPLDQTESASLAFAKAAGCAYPGSVLDCLRSKPAAALLDAGAAFSPSFTSGTSVFPVPLQQAVDAGNFARVPIVAGSNRDEGRTFLQSAIGWTKAQYVAFVQATFGTNADAVLARYPWPANADTFTAAYLAGAIFTDAGLAAGIGGCTNLQLVQTFAQYTTTYAYEFDARNGPGLVPIPGYVWGAGHAAELAYLFPSFNNGTPIAPTFNAGERQLSRDMVQYWGGFVFTGSPNYHGQAWWPSYNATQRIMSLRPAGASQTISTTAYRSEHQCDFWDALTPAA